MTSEKLAELLHQGEGIDIEFKISQFELNKNAFETICAFLNRRGGHLLLGVKDNGTVEGVFEDCAQDIVNNIVTNANNPQKLNPPFYLSTQIMEYEEKKVIYVYVPESSQVHSVNGKIYDRNEDGDFDITRQTEQVTQLYLRKQTTYSENRIYPYVKFSDFKQELFGRIRTLAKNERPDHPWQGLTDKELLRSAGLFKRDHQTGKEGYTLASVLLLGKDEVIQSVLPHHKTDAILRKDNLDRYDDRDDIRVNLIESYDRLMAFVRKHLPDKFYQEGDQRISLRDRIFREIIGNLLIHREFANAFPAKLIIEKERVFTENWNRPHGVGIINPVNFSPYPKNPVIARFFKEIGRVDELGSGVRNTFKYCGVYTPGSQPEFFEEDIFRTVIPLKTIDVVKDSNVYDAVSDAVNDAVSDAVKERLGKELAFIITHSGISLEELKKEFHIKRATAQRDMKQLKDIGWVDFVGAPKTGKYMLTEQGEKQFGNRPLYPGQDNSDQ